MKPNSCGKSEEWIRWESQDSEWLMLLCRRWDERFLQVWLVSEAALTVNVWAVTPAPAEARALAPRKQRRYQTRGLDQSQPRAWTTPPFNNTTYSLSLWTPSLPLIAAQRDRGTRRIYYIHNPHVSPNPRDSSQGNLSQQRTCLGYITYRSDCWCQKCCSGKDAFWSAGCVWCMRCGQLHETPLNSPSCV